MITRATRHTARSVKHTAETDVPQFNLDDVALVGRSETLRAVLRRVERVAPTDITVLVLGERGTGKELIARALVARSRRHDKPLIAINCAALSADLLASELFGHERGAFTGATERKPGLLVSALGGTVFLDEVGDLPPLGQAVLLRFLQEREVRAVGATATHRVDVRVIAATNRDLHRSARHGDFREDLYDRLHGVTITVSPLRDRADDIPLLAEHFAAQYASRYGVPKPRLAADTIKCLREHTWPGNIRELEHAIARAVLFCEDGCARPYDLDLDPAPAASIPDEQGTIPALTARQRCIVQFGVERGVIRRADVARRFGISGEAARRDLHALTRYGLLQHEGRRRNSRYTLACSEP